MRGLALNNVQRAQLDIVNLKFAKTGGEIQQAIDTRVTTLGGKIEAAQQEVQKICKDREIDATEVLEAGIDEEKIGAYSSKIMNSAPRAQSALRALEDDIAKLKIAAHNIEYSKKTIEDLTLIKRHVQAGRSFDLDLSELYVLGFK